MKISFKTEGGYGFFPGLNKSLEIDTDKLPKDEAENVTGFVDKIKIPDQLAKKEQGNVGADMKTYTIEIENNNKRSKFSVSDDEGNSDVNNLLEYLKKKHKEGR